ncbi:16S rRNA (guanine(966)-N(2))-methyltransferase RsmD [Noviherbaspirillum sp. 1P10PC]|uniref:16S rRNA (guanine(966)-N(2))-methyltransferase RsmD n=1 Tax=Noviherbaspirillum sp. 1P10PC TaxID=3132292 RepID=UPI0039A2AA22
MKHHRTGASRQASAAPRHAPRQVRILGGQWKRTPLPVMDAEGLRPTPDRVRETLFNWLDHLLDRDWHDLQCLDLFAGSGGLGLEAASRGAARVLMVESQPAAVRQLQAVCDKLKADKVEARRGDALATAAALARSDARFGLIFLDPPYHQDWLQRMLPLCERLLTPGGLVYVEAEMALDTVPPPEWLQGWQLLRSDRAGMVHYHLFTLQPAA